MRLKREGELPRFMLKINPPGYKKRGGSRVLWLVLRNDQYRIDVDTIVIKSLGVISRISVRYKGLIHVRGKQGKMEIRYDPDLKKWYAHVTFEVEEKAVRGEWQEVPAETKGD